MTKDPKKGQADRLAQMDRFFIDGLLATSDKALLDEAAEDGVDIKEATKKGREAFELAQRAVGRRRLDAVRRAIEEDNQKKVVPIDRNRARLQINEIIRRNKETSSKLTMAARNQEATDHEEDIDGLLEDFVELGVIKGNELDTGEK